MLKLDSVKRNLKKVTAITQRNLLFETRFKLTFIQNLITPLVQMIIFFIIFGTIFTINKDYIFGYWGIQNYLIFLLLGFSIQYLRPIASRFARSLQNEKYWKTLQAILIAPINRFLLILGIVIEHLIAYSLPILILLFIAFIIYPISFEFLILVILIYMCIVLTFGGIGLLIGVFTITNENVASVSSLVLQVIFWLSCITYPLEIFPEPLRFFIKLNPLFYYFDLLRLVWLLGIDYNTAIKFITLTHILVVIIFTISILALSVYFFDKIFNKYGITGY